MSRALEDVRLVGLAECLQGRVRGRDGRVHAGVIAPVQAEHGRADAVQLRGVGRAAVIDDRRSHSAGFDRVHERRAATPAESDDAVLLRCRGQLHAPVGDGTQLPVHVGARQRPHRGGRGLALGLSGRVLRHVRVREQVGGDRDEAGRGELVRDRADPVGDAVDLVHHEDDRGGRRALGIDDPRPDAVGLAGPDHRPFAVARRGVQAGERGAGIGRKRRGLGGRRTRVRSARGRGLAVRGAVGRAGGQRGGGQQGRGRAQGRRAAASDDEGGGPLCHGSLRRVGGACRRGRPREDAKRGPDACPAPAARAVESVRSRRPPAPT